MLPFKLSFPSIHQLQVFAILSSLLAFSLILALDDSTIIKNRSILTLTNLTCFSANFGAHIWVTLFAGMIMILTIPRYWFGQLQARIFPIFFTYGTIMSAVTMTTLLILRKDYNGTAHFRMVLICGLTVSFVTSLLNLCILSSLIVDIMRKRFDLEKESGLSMKIGFVDMSPLAGNDVYQEVNRKFRFYHKLNGLTNILGMLGQFIYLYYLADFIHIK